MAIWRPLSCQPSVWWVLLLWGRMRLVSGQMQVPGMHRWISTVLDVGTVTVQRNGPGARLQCIVGPRDPETKRRSDKDTGVQRIAKVGRAFGSGGQPPVPEDSKVAAGE